MSRFGSHGKQEANLASAEQLLTQFGFTASANGELRIRLVAPVIRYEYVATILKRLADERVDVGVPEIVFDFGTVEWIEAPWTAVVARFIDFARASHARCRLAALSGQPAAVIGFFSSHRAVRRLLHPDLPQAVSTAQPGRPISA